MDDDIKEEFESIKALISSKGFSFETKVQLMGKNTDGSVRFMLYCTRAARMLKLEKGEKVEVFIRKLPEEEGKVLKNVSEVNVVDVKEEKEEVDVFSDLTDSEKAFVSQFVKEANITSKNLLLLQAESELGADRVKELIDLSSERLSKE